MKKIIVILIGVVSITLVAFLGWYFLIGDGQEVPIGEIIKNSLPFGFGEDAPGLTTTTSTSSDNIVGESFGTDKFGSPVNNLFRISDTPVAGAVVFTRNAETIVRYVNRATGHIYDVTLPKEVGPGPIEKIKITNNTLPKIYEAYFRPDGNAVLLRSLKDDSDVVENLSITLTPPKATSSDTLYTISSTPLRGDIGAVAVAGSGNTLFYVLRDTSSVVTSAFDGTGAKTLLTSVFSNWRLAMAGNSLVAYTKASASAAGYTYTLNTSSGALTKILGPLNGLVAISNNSGSRVLYSYVDNNRTKLIAKNVQNNALSEISPATLAEKCVWSTKKVDILVCGTPTDELGHGEPDNWYRGVTHFSDRIWSFDTGTETAQVLAEPKESLGVDIDVMEPKLSPNENFLIFVNKTDLSLWALRLE